MKFRAAAIDVTDDQGNRIGGPYFLPLDDAAKHEIRTLELTFGRLELKTKEQPNV